jgi:hypothetical protein
VTVEGAAPIASGRTHRRKRFISAHWLKFETGVEPFIGDSAFSR